ncbi:cytochrome C biogenesis protein CcdA [Candidatus Beckwithbacteria bacterium CG22_combo_CG10-13_8_21_14_all_01_47_9]|uniref:Cytochrome C biogenesis protein CcdA n=2 Tax=Candidatus Beckwithiibacteriota TaxID=1752726 RepID=A0A2H0E213_9BACT|nr:MAG: cytochrome C biogenesis protein CcdA [Candidatus Beckwithbacteria bacterium CG22_combo_CG10-13_8_21_14_all_01_47_9]PJC66027.1 MAG: cytochrome C biogenesis protein CcdA [Candidatus Beckwithbacteria bacterium CG_4_9_14_0_2_um_filter_47_11]
MKMIYVTLGNNDEARKIGRELLDKKLANCVNFFPITCIYNYKNEITEEPETVLIIKTKDGYYDKVKSVIKSHIDYDNFIGQLSVDKLNDDFSSWLNAVVK